MESIPNNFSALDQALYNKYMSKNPGNEMSMESFMNVRRKALGEKDPDVKTFYEVSGILTTEMPTADEIKEMRPGNTNQQ